MVRESVSQISHADYLVLIDFEDTESSDTVNVAPIVTVPAAVPAAIPAAPAVIPAAPVAVLQPVVAVCPDLGSELFKLKFTTNRVYLPTLSVPGEYTNAPISTSDDWPKGWYVITRGKRVGIFTDW